MNVQFYWTMLLGALSKLAFNNKFCSLQMREFPMKGCFTISITLLKPLSLRSLQSFKLTTFKEQPYPYVFSPFTQANICFIKYPRSPLWSIKSFLSQLSFNFNSNNLFWAFNIHCKEIFVLKKKKSQKIGNNKLQKYLTNKRMYKKEYFLKIKSRRYVILLTLLGFFSKVIILFFLKINDLKIHYNFFFHFWQFFQCNGFWCVLQSLLTVYS
jgi:hypothetical protein